MPEEIIYLNIVSIDVNYQNIDEINKEEEQNSLTRSGLVYK